MSLTAKKNKKRVSRESGHKREAFRRRKKRKKKRKDILKAESLGEGGRRREEKNATTCTKDTRLRRSSDKMQPVNILHHVLFALLIIAVTTSIAGKLQSGECKCTYIDMINRRSNSQCEN